MHADGEKEDDGNNLKLFSSSIVPSSRGAVASSSSFRSVRSSKFDLSSFQDSGRADPIQCPLDDQALCAHIIR